MSSSSNQPDQNNSNKDKDDLIGERKEIFSDNKELLFDQVKALEDRYDYTLKKNKEKLDLSIQSLQRENGARYRKALEEKKKDVEKKVQAMYLAVDQALNELEKHADEIVDQIETIFAEKSNQVLEEIIKELGIDF